MKRIIAVFVETSFVESVLMELTRLLYLELRSFDESDEVAVEQLDERGHQVMFAHLQRRVLVDDLK